MFSLAGKRAMVTGASSGIGLHIAGVLARAGASVALAARRVDRLEVTVGELRRAGHNACAIQLDATKPGTISTAWTAAEASIGGGIDVLFNNAGVIYHEKFVDQKLDEIDRVFDTNLRGAFLVAQEGARRMAERGSGSIINVSSTAGMRAGGGLASYGASKAGLIHLTKVMALELAGQGVRVNALCPGNIETDMHQVFAEHGLEERLLRRIPMHRFGQPQDLAGPTLLLASDAASYLTGTIINVDGGQVLTWM